MGATCAGTVEATAPEAIVDTEITYSVQILVKRGSSRVGPLPQTGVHEPPSFILFYVLRT